jgi:hypothetical protein
VLIVQLVYIVNIIFAFLQLIFFFFFKVHVYNHWWWRRLRNPDGAVPEKVMVTPVVPVKVIPGKIDPPAPVCETWLPIRVVCNDGAGPVRTSFNHHYLIVARMMYRMAGTSVSSPMALGINFTG